MKLPKCCYCVNLYINDQLIAPTDKPTPHISGTCDDCPYPDAYGIVGDPKYANPLGIWIDLEKMKAWVDGSGDVKDDCPNYKPSPLIFSNLRKRKK
jgi:hypothetical protein